jgi:hypothetical protein
MVMSEPEAYFTSPWRGEVGALGRARARLKKAAGGRKR